MGRSSYWVYERPDGHPFVSVVERESRCLGRYATLAEAKAALARAVEARRASARRGEPGPSGGAEA